MWWAPEENFQELVLPFSRVLRDYKSLDLEGKCSYPPTHLASPFFFDWYVIVLITDSLGFPRSIRTETILKARLNQFLRKHVKQKMVEGRSENVLEGLSEKKVRHYAKQHSLFFVLNWKGEKHKLNGGQET